MPGPEQEQSAQRHPDFFKTYHSVFEYRYGSPEMRSIWSEHTKWMNVRKVWIAAAEVQHNLGLVSREELEDLRENLPRLDVQKIFDLEKEKGHDVAAAIAEFSEKAPVGGRIIHQGMTSEDVLSNAEIPQIQEAFKLVNAKLDKVLLAFAEGIDRTKDLVCMGWTHLQAAEPTTVGYRLARYGQDLLMDRQQLTLVREMIKGKGIKGAVGTSASFAHLLEGTGITPGEHERQIMEKLGIEPVQVSAQTYPRKIDVLTTATLALIGESLHRFGLDVQLLQSSPFAEWAEPRRKKQIGSSAMPHKQNPINVENICSLTRGLPGKLIEAWIVGANEILERTLTDSAGKRSWLPESFLIVDEALTRAERVVRGLVVHEEVIQRNMRQFGPFAALELILAEASKKGADRQETHEILRELAEEAQNTVWRGETNPLKGLVLQDERLTPYFSSNELDGLFGLVDSHIGDAPERAQRLANQIKVTLKV